LGEGSTGPENESQRDRQKTLQGEEKREEKREERRETVVVMVRLQEKLLAGHFSHLLIHVPSGADKLTAW